MTVWVTQIQQDLHEPQRAHVHALHRFCDLSAAAARFCWSARQAQRAAAKGLVYCLDGLDHTIVCRPQPLIAAIHCAHRPWILHLHHQGGGEVSQAIPGAVTVSQLASFVSRPERAC